MEESEENMSSEDVNKVNSSTAVKKPKKRSLVERELETNMTSRVTSPTIADGLSTSRYGRARRLKTESTLIESQKMLLASVKSPGNENTPVKVTSPVYRMHACNSPNKAEIPKKALGSPNDNVHQDVSLSGFSENASSPSPAKKLSKGHYASKSFKEVETPQKSSEIYLENQINNIYQENISLSRFSENARSPSPAKKFPKVYIRKDLIQKREAEETVMLIKNLFSPSKSATKSSSRLLRNSLEHSSEKYNAKQNGHVDNASVVKMLDFDSNKKKRKDTKDQKQLSKNELFELEAKCPYQVGDLAWARVGTFPFWPCIVTREPYSEMFVKRKLFGRVEHDIVHVTFFGDNGRRSWIIDNMLRKYSGQLEFEAAREKFTPQDKKKDPRLYAAFFVSEKKQALWNTSVDEAEILLREPKRLRIDIFNDMLWKFRASQKNQKSGKITRTNSDVSLSESLYDSLFSEDDTKADDTERKNRSKNKPFDVSEVVTACLDNMAAKTGITKIQRQSHMDRWLQKAKSKTPEKSQTKSLERGQTKSCEKSEAILVENTLTKEPETNQPKKTQDKTQPIKQVNNQAKLSEKSHALLPEKAEKSETEIAAVPPVAKTPEKTLTTPSKGRIKLNRKISPKNTSPSISLLEKRYRFRSRDPQHTLSHKEENLINENKSINNKDSLSPNLDGIIKLKSVPSNDNNQDISPVILIDDDCSGSVVQPNQKSNLDISTTKSVNINDNKSDNVKAIKDTETLITVHGENSDFIEPTEHSTKNGSKISAQTNDKTSEICKTMQDSIMEIDENPDNLIDIKKSFKEVDKKSSDSANEANNSIKSDSHKSGQVFSIETDVCSKILDNFVEPTVKNHDSFDIQESLNQDEKNKNKCGGSLQTDQKSLESNEICKDVTKNDVCYNIPTKNNNPILEIHQGAQASITTDCKNTDSKIDYIDKHSATYDISKNSLMEVDKDSVTRDNGVELNDIKLDSCESSKNSDVKQDASLEGQTNKEKSILKSKTVSNKSLEVNEFELTENNCDLKSDIGLKEAQIDVTIEASVTETKNDDTIYKQAEGEQQESKVSPKPLDNTDTNINKLDILDVSINQRADIIEASQMTTHPQNTSTFEKSIKHDDTVSKVEITNCKSSVKSDLENQCLNLDAIEITHYQKVSIHKSCENILQSETNISKNENIEDDIFPEDSTDDILNKSGDSESILQLNNVLGDPETIDCLTKDTVDTSLNESFQSESIFENSELNECIEKDDVAELCTKNANDSKNLSSVLEDSHDSSIRNYVESPTFTQLLESQEFFRDVNESCNNVLNRENKNSETSTKQSKLISNLDNQSETADNTKKNVTALKNGDDISETEDSSDDEPSPEYESLDEDIAEDFRKHMMSIENNVTDKKDEEQIVKICNEIAEKAKLSPTKYTVGLEVAKPMDKLHTTIEKSTESIVLSLSTDRSEPNSIDEKKINDVQTHVAKFEDKSECGLLNAALTKEDQNLPNDIYISNNITLQTLPEKADANKTDNKESSLKINGDATAEEISSKTKIIYKTRLSMKSVNKEREIPEAPRELSEIEKLRKSCELEPKVLIIPLEKDKLNHFKGSVNKAKLMDEDTCESKTKLRLSLRRASSRNKQIGFKPQEITEGEVKIPESRDLNHKPVIEESKIETVISEPVKIQIENDKHRLSLRRDVSKNKQSKIQEITEGEVKPQESRDLNLKSVKEESITETVISEPIKINVENDKHRLSLRRDVSKNKQSKIKEITEGEVKPLEPRDLNLKPVVEESKIETVLREPLKTNIENDKHRLCLSKDISENKQSKTQEITEVEIKLQESKNENVEAESNKETVNYEHKNINVENGVIQHKKSGSVNGYHNYVDRKYANTPDLIDDIDFNIDAVSLNSEDSSISSCVSIESVPKRNLRMRPDRTLESALQNPEFLKYLELRQDYLLDEHPDLNEDEVILYVYKTWQYEEDLKNKKSDSPHNSTLVKGIKQETPSQKKSKNFQPKNNIENYFREKYEKCRKTFDFGSEAGPRFDSSEAVRNPEVRSKSSFDTVTDESKGNVEKVPSKRKTRSKSPDVVDLTSESSNNVHLVKDKCKVLDTISVKSEETLTPKRSLRSKPVTPKSIEKQNNDIEVISSSVKKEREIDSDSICSEESEIPLRLLRSKALKQEMINSGQDSIPERIVEITSANMPKDPTIAPEIKDENDEIASTASENEPLIKRKKKRTDKQSIDDPEFIKYLELKQDALMDENPQLAQDEIVNYLYKTWIYEEKSKSDIKKNEDLEQAGLVKGLNNNDATPPKKVRRRPKTEKKTEIDTTHKEKPKRTTIQPYYNENYSDIEDEIEMFEIFKTKKAAITVVSKVETDKDKSKSKDAVKSEKDVESLKVTPKSEEVIEIGSDETVKEEIGEIQDETGYVDSTEFYFTELTKPKPNVFKGLIREKVCELCELAGNLVKCKGCSGMFHADCVKKEAEEIDKSSGPTRGRKKKRGRKLKNFDDSESQSDEKSQNVSVENMSVEDIVPPEIFTIDADAFESELSVKMKELLDSADVNYDSYSSDDGIDWKDAVAGKCEIVTVKLKHKRPPIDYSNFKCNNCHVHDSPVCFVCKLAVSSTNVKMRQKCNVAHCHKYYHLECLKHWPQTQFNSGEPSKNNKKINEFFEALTCPRHVCHTCVSDDPRGCKTRFSGDKLAKCVRCPATYHSFNKCLPAGTQILTASHIICPRHLDQIPGKVPCHVNAGWCFICAQGGSLICCEYCPTSFHAECLNIKPPEGNYMCEDCETGRLPLYGEMVWVKLGHYRWWPAMILHPSEIPDNIMAVNHSLGEFVVRFFGQYDHFWVNRGRVFPYQEGDSGRVSNQRTKIDADFTLAIEHAQRAYAILKNAEPNDEESDIASSLLPPHYVKLKCNKPCGSLCGRKMEDPSLSLTQCDCNPDEPDPCGPYSQCLNRMLLTECGPTCLAGERCNNRAFEKRLYPKLTPYRTPHRGWGLKTLEDIKGGQFVIEYVGELIDEEEFRRRMRRMHEIRDENFYFLTLDKERMIDAGPKGNLARFMNHCCEPNCETQKWTVLGDIRVGLFAIDDIPANSEVTFNYNLQCAGIEKKRCMCGAKRCSGYIGAKPKQDESQSKKGKEGKLASKRTNKKKKDSPSTSKIKPKRPLGRPRKPKVLTDIEKDILIIKTATSVSSSDDSSRSQSIEDKKPPRSKSIEDKTPSITQTQSIEDTKLAISPSIEDKKPPVSPSIEDKKPAVSPSIEDKKPDVSQSVEDKRSSKSRSRDNKNRKTIKRKRAFISTEEVSLCNGYEPSVKKQKCEDKSSVVGD